MAGCLADQMVVSFGSQMQVSRAQNSRPSSHSGCVQGRRQGTSSIRSTGSAIHRTMPCSASSFRGGRAPRQMSGPAAGGGLLFVCSSVVPFSWSGRRHRESVGGRSFSGCHGCSPSIVAGGRRMGAFGGPLFALSRCSGSCLPLRALLPLAGDSLLLPARYPLRSVGDDSTPTDYVGHDQPGAGGDFCEWRPLHTSCVGAANPIDGATHAATQISAPTHGQILHQDGVASASQAGTGPSRLVGDAWGIEKTSTSPAPSGIIAHLGQNSTAVRRHITRSRAIDQRDYGIDSGGRAASKRSIGGLRHLYQLAQVTDEQGWQQYRASGLKSEFQASELRKRGLFARQGRRPSDKSSDHGVREAPGKGFEHDCDQASAHGGRSGRAARHQPGPFLSDEFLRATWPPAHQAG